jgi:D-alanine-D-alanine ligase
VKVLIEKYRQPALVEEYVTGREFTVGLLGEKRPRVLPPMEIVFKDKSKDRPVYDFDVKQEWEKHVEYLCPAPLSPAELKSIQKAARDTFDALDCRDVARVDLRMNPQGQVFVLEVNPLPGLTPDYSDLVLISKAANMDYRTLIGEILAGGLRRMREKRREERTDRTEKSEKSDKPDRPAEKTADKAAAPDKERARANGLLEGRPTS